ncbi:MAG TPA: hypothetical protein VMI94_16065 [Bryobacteraceae bacterium]|nr:hypothetical protein [Bryobacteraceae bacterium]
MRTAVLGFLLLRLLAAAPGSERSAIFLFGPASADGARQAAHAASTVAYRWLSQPDSWGELRRAGSIEGLVLDPKARTRALDPLFQEAARQARDTDPDAFLRSLDRAAQSVALRPGLHLLVTIVEEPALSTEAQTELKQIVAFCRSNLIRVVVLDPGENPGKKAAGVLAELGEQTGGALIREAKALDSAVLIAISGSKTGATPYEPPEAAAAEANTDLQPLAGDLPVDTQFMRISPRGSQTVGVQRAVGAGQGGITSVDTGLNTEATTGPMRGLLIVESPLSALHFVEDDNSGTYTARARVTQIARNRAGKIVWRASKQVTMHGPLKRLPERRAGNLYYLREVMLPAGQYTLEATVDDLIAGKSGGVRRPLRTSMGTPGFTVSDALLVRPFNGAGDKFEADQVLQYDGNAISPLLDPVYRANEPFTLQIYLVAYPDIYGAQPQMSLEILRNGHVVGRSSLPFTDKLRNDVVEASGMSSMVGEQKHEFPYLATLRGVQLGAGNYEARVTVRQGAVALTRPVEFRVVGNEHGAAVASAGRPAAAPSDADEDAEVTLPEVDPVHMAADSGALTAAKQQELWERAAAGAMSYASHLPNFRCRRETRRLTAPVRGFDRFRESDSIIEEFTYEGNKETFQTLEVNGQKSTARRDDMQGVHSRGEFGAILKSVFRPEAAAQYKWSGRAMAGGVLCAVFDVDVPVSRSIFVVTFNLRQEVAGFHGRVFIDEDSGLVRRMVLAGNGLPRDFGLQSPTLSLEYGMVRIGTQDHLLPLRSVLQVRQGKKIVRNETEFRAYRRFEAESEIKFQ